MPLKRHSDRHQNVTGLQTKYVLRRHNTQHKGLISDTQHKRHSTWQWFAIRLNVVVMSVVLLTDVAPYLHTNLETYNFTFFIQNLCLNERTFRECSANVVEIEKSAQKTE